jgi:hypothetical protein
VILPDLLVPPNTDVWFNTIEWIAFRGSLLLLFLIGLYRIVRHEVRNGKESCPYCPHCAEKVRHEDHG